MVARLYQYRFGQREGLIVQIGDGWGEIAPLPGFSQETLAEAREETLAALRREKEPALPSVRFGLSCAATPLSLEPLRLPLCAFQEPRPGFSSLKIKVGKLPLADAIAKVKTLVGKFRLRVDCNRGWSYTQAIKFASHFSPSDFEFLEEPLQTFEELVCFSKETGFPIAADESLRDSSYIDIPTLKAAIVKPTLMGRVPDLPVPIVLSSSFESSLGILQIARLAKPDAAHGLDTFSDDLLIPPLRRDNGYLIWTPSSSMPIDKEKLCCIATLP